MEFKFDENTKTISEINQLLRKDELIVDHSYQRRAIWSNSDKVRLIETILLNYVIPSVYFWQSEIDPDTGESKIHIVDGQQRITAISEFVSGKLKLTGSYLLDDNCKTVYNNKYFSDLDDKDKTKIWNYRISVIEIDKSAREIDVINMFSRLNLTEYTLNAQEKRHANKGLFHEFATELSNNIFWENLNIFNTSDLKRMNDVTYCSNIIILSKRGIVDQANINKPINEAYEKYKEEYAELDNDKKNIENAINYFLELLESEPAKEYNSFFRKKVQNYTIFSLIFYMMRKNIVWDLRTKDRLYRFVKIYIKFKNENSEQLNLSVEEQELFDFFRRYKLASSEGVNKLSNRTIRFNILKDLVIKDEHSYMDNELLVETLFCKIISKK